MGFFASLIEAFINFFAGAEPASEEQKAAFLVEVDRSIRKETQDRAKISKTTYFKNYF